MSSAWPSIHYEQLPWSLTPEERQLIPKSRRRKITSTYRAAIPAEIASLQPKISDELLRRASEIATALAHFDGAQKERPYKLPALILRSESAASSQIENLTSSVRNVALAEIVDNAPGNARLIAGNVAAMRQALLRSDELSVQSILAVHRTLIEPTGESFGGNLRDEQVWIGGTPYSPHGALFVPPTPVRIPPLLEDLVAFSNRTDIDPLVQTAIAHAQFETIHPFIDGNGRTGRALVHKQLALTGVLEYSTLPVSSGLLSDMDSYMKALDSYHEGEIEPMVETLCDALEIALELGERSLDEIESILASWEEMITERAGSRIHELPALLVEQPVVNAAYVAAHLGMTERAARDLLARAAEHGIVEQAGNRKRGRFYQASELIDTLEKLASAPAIRRALSNR